MPDIIQREILDTDPVVCLHEEIDQAAKGRQAISRFGLSEIVSERTGMPFDQAQLLVDAYCEEKAPHVPAYLRGEFNLFWPKFVGFVFAVGGIAVFYYGMTLKAAKKPHWLWFAIGTVVFGIGLFQWIRSLERFQRRTAERQARNNARLRAKYSKRWQGRP